MWGNTKKLAMALTLAVGSLGCAGQAVHQGLPANAFAGTTGDEGATIEVTNYNWSDMTVYAVQRGTPVRLGSVMSMATEEFKVPREMVGATDLHIVADPTGSGTGFRTRPVLVVPGQKIQFRIENQVDLSTVSVW